MDASAYLEPALVVCLPAKEDDFLASHCMRRFSRCTDRWGSVDELPVSRGGAHAAASCHCRSSASDCQLGVSTQPVYCFCLFIKFFIREIIKVHFLLSCFFCRFYEKLSLIYLITFLSARLKTYVLC